MKRWQWAVIAIVLILVVLGFVAAVIYLNGQTSPTPTVHTFTIINGQDIVNAGDYKDHLFTIPSGASNIHVSGTFTAQGGSGNDTKVYVIDSTNFDNYVNKNTFSSLYYSGQIHSATFNITLTSGGDYHLVDDNRFSTQSSKTVTIQVNATYTK